MNLINYLKLFFAAILWCSFTPTKKSFTDYDVTVTGFFFGFDGTTNSQFPLTGARIELMDSDADGSELFDDVMGVDYVQPDGSFKVTGRGGDPDIFNLAKPDVYIRLVYNNDKGIRLTDELDHDRTANTPEHDHNNFEGTLDIGSWVTDFGADGGTWSSVWRAGCKEWDDYVKIMGGEIPPSGRFDIEYWSAIWDGVPWTNDKTTHWPIDYPASGMRHEFGHLIRHAADGDRQHFDWDANRFRYGRYHDDPCDPNCNRIGGENHAKGLGFGFNEGWAEYWDNETSGCGVTIDDECEGNARWALNNVSMNIGGKKNMVKVLIANPYKIHSVEEFAQAAADMLNSGEITKLIKLHTDRPKPIRRANSIYMDQSLQLKKINAFTDQGEKEIMELKEKITTAKKNASARKNCSEEIDCNKVLQAKILPITLKMECLVKEAALKRIKKTSSPSYLNKFAERTYTDSLYSIEQNKNQLEVNSIITNCYKEIINSIQPLKKQSKELGLLVADYEKKYTSLLTKIKEYGQLPNTIVIPHFSSEGKCIQVKSPDGYLK